jgi:hypothetical protein
VVFNTRLVVLPATAGPTVHPRPHDSRRQPSELHRRGRRPQRYSSVIAAPPLPAGASFTEDSAGSPDLSIYVLDWTQVIGRAGDYDIYYPPSDGDFEVSQTTRITVSVRSTIRNAPARGVASPCTPASTSSPTPGPCLPSMPPVSPRKERFTTKSAKKHEEERGIRKESCRTYPIRWVESRASTSHLT